MFFTRNKEFLLWAGVPHATGWRTRPGDICGYDISILKEFHYFQKLELFDNLVRHLEKCLVCCAPIRHLKHNKVLDEHFKMEQSLRVLLIMYNSQHSEHTSKARIAYFNEGFDLYVKKQFPGVEFAKVQRLPSKDNDASATSSPSKLSLGMKGSRQTATNPTQTNSSEITSCSVTTSSPNHKNPRGTAKAAFPPKYNTSRTISPHPISPISTAFSPESSRHQRSRDFLKKLFSKQKSDSPSETADPRRQKVKIFFKKVFSQFRQKFAKPEQRIIKRDMRLAVAIIDKMAPEGRLPDGLRFCIQTIKKLQPSASVAQKYEPRCRILPNRETAKLGAKSTKAICWFDFGAPMELQDRGPIREFAPNKAPVTDYKKKLANLVAFRTIKTVGNVLPFLIVPMRDIFEAQVVVSVLMLTYKAEACAAALLYPPLVQKAPEKLSEAPEKKEKKTFFKPFDLTRARATVHAELSARERAYKAGLRALKSFNVTYRGMDVQKLIIDKTLEECAKVAEPLDSVLFSGNQGKTPYMAVPSPFRYNEDEDPEMDDETVDYAKPSVSDNKSSPCVIDGTVHITRCHHKNACHAQTRDVTPLLENDYLRKFVQFSQLAYPRLGFRCLQLDDFQQLATIAKQRESLIEGLQDGCARWHRQHCLAKSQTLEKLTIVTSMRAAMSHVDTNELKLIKYFPYFWRQVRDLSDEERFHRIGDFILETTISIQQRIKRWCAKEMTMHQVYLENMALLLDPEFVIPQNYEFEIVVLLDEHIECVYKELNLMSWSQLRPLTDEVDWASMAYAFTHNTLSYVLGREDSVRKLKDDLANI